MIITLYGPDAYRRKEKFDTLRRDALQGTVDAVREFDLEREDESGRCAEFIGARSLFGARRVAIVRNAFFPSASKQLKVLLKNRGTESDLTVLISELALPKGFEFLKTKPNQALSFEKLSEAELKKFLAHEAKQRGVTLDEPAAAYLLSSVAGESWGVVNELDKLALLPDGQASVAVLRALGARKPLNFFGLVGGWASASVKERLFSLELLLGRGEDPAKLFNILSYQNQNAVRAFADYDVAIKSGRLEYAEALLDAALR